MSKQLKEVINEIFKDIEVSVVPVTYIKSITIEFENGKTWEIDISAEKLKKSLKTYRQKQNASLKK